LDDPDQGCSLAEGYLDQLHRFALQLGESFDGNEASHTAGAAGEFCRQVLVWQGFLRCWTEEVPHRSASAARNQIENWWGRPRASLFDEIYERPRDIIAGELRQAKPGRKAGLSHSGRIHGYSGTTTSSLHAATQPSVKDLL